MTRPLRSHQAATLRLAREIAAGSPVREVFEAVTPGGGKSALPGILANELFPAVADRLLWVVPRNSLREQAEGDFPEWSRYRIRAAGNEAAPCRGVQGYVTTYQAIVADPARHLCNVCDGRRWIVFLDEPHHVQAGGAWDQALAPLVERARLVVYASGTFSRGDGQRIAGLRYREDGTPWLEDREGTAVVRYSRGDALREGAIAPVYFRHLDGRAEWEDEQGELRSTDTLARGDYAPAALFTALRTGYALELLDECLADWRRHRAEVYPSGKLLVVAPNIEFAGTYLEHLRRRGVEALIATSDDSPAAGQAIARFKGQALPSTECLITCQMAYEGLSVPAISHVACLTHIRSVPWLEQCFARANRRAPGKVAGFIFGPADWRFRDAIASIEAEQVQAIRDAAEAQGEAPAGDSEGGEGSGFGRPGIRPIGSAAYREASEELFAEPEPAPERPDGGMTPREAERLLRKQIADHIEAKLAKTRPGSKGPITRLIYRDLANVAGGKKREDCTVAELAAQWARLKERWPV